MVPTVAARIICQIFDWGIGSARTGVRVESPMSLLWAGHNGPSHLCFAARRCYGLGQNSNVDSLPRSTTEVPKTTCTRRALQLRSDADRVRAWAASLREYRKQSSCSWQFTADSGQLELLLVAAQSSARAAK